MSNKAKITANQTTGKVQLLTWTRYDSHEGTKTRRGEEENFKMLSGKKQGPVRLITGSDSFLPLPHSFVASCLRVIKINWPRSGSHEGTKTRRGEEEIVSIALVKKRGKVRAITEPGPFFTLDNIDGRTSRNLLTKKVFSRDFSVVPIAKQPVSQLPWGHILHVLQRSKDSAAATFTSVKQSRRDGAAASWKFRFRRPGDVGQLNLYLSAVDDLLRHQDDQPTIGLLLCRKKNKLVAEYALRGLDQSIAVAAWQTQLTESLPEELRSSLPTIEEIEAEFANEIPLVKSNTGGES